MIAHPNTPRDVAFALGASTPRALADCPRGATLFADSLARPPRANHLRALLSWSGAPDLWFDRASWHGSPSVRRLAVALRASMPDDFVARLARDPRADVRADVARRPDLPRRWRDRLLVDEAPLVRAAVAGRDDLDDEVRMALARDPALAVRVAAARHPETPAIALVRLARERDPDITQSLVDNPATPADALAVLADPIPESWFVASAIGRHPRADARIAASVLAHPSAKYRSDVLLSLRVVTDEQWRALLADPDRRVRHTIGFHKETPTWTLALLAEDAEPLVRGAAAWSPRTPPGGVAKLCRDEAPTVRAAAAENPGATEEDRRALSLDPQPIVRLAVARRSRDPAVLEALSRDPDARVRSAVHFNRAAPIEVRNRLALDADVRWLWQAG